MQRAGETGERGGVREERVSERRADQVASVRRDVATLVVGCAESDMRYQAGLTVQGVVEADDLDEAGLVAKADLVGVVPRQILPPSVRVPDLAVRALLLSIGASSPPLP